MTGTIRTPPVQVPVEPKAMTTIWLNYPNNLNSSNINIENIIHDVKSEGKAVSEETNGRGNRGQSRGLNGDVTYVLLTRLHERNSTFVPPRSRLIKK